MSKFDVSNISVSGEYVDFQTGHFDDFEQFKIDRQELKSLGKSKLTLLVCLYQLRQVTVILLSLGEMLGREKQSKPSLSDLKSKNQALNLAQVIFNDLKSAWIKKNCVPKLINRLQRFNLLFLSVTRFSDLCDKKNILDKNKDTKSFT